MSRYTTRLALFAAWYCGLSLLLSSSPVGADIHNVSVGQSIQAVIDSAEVTAGDEVVLAAGTYHERINFNGKAITVRSTDPDDPFVVGSTVLDGDQGGTVVVFNHGETAASVLTGLTITRGWGVSGGGIYCGECSPTISKNWVHSNYATAYGGGISCYLSDATVVSNRVWGNQAEQFGGGIYTYCNLPTVRANTVVANGATLRGGGIYWDYSAGPLSGNLILANTAGTIAGGLYCRGPNQAVIFNTVAGNSAPTGGGIGWEDASPRISNCIVYASSDGGAISGSGGTVTYCDVYANTGGDYVNGAAAGPGCFSANPLFADSGALDFHLKSTAGRWNGTAWVTDTVNSPCLDAGDPAAAYGGEPAPNGNHVNVGAYGNTAEASKSPQLARIVETGRYWPGVQVAMNAAGVGQTVEVSAGTHHERIDFLGKAITVRSTAPDDPAVVAATIIDGDAGGSVVSFTHGETNAALLEGLTITDGSAATGAGVLCNGSSPTIRGNRITGNAGNNGVGIDCVAASPRIEGNTISGNTAPNGQGVGIGCYQGSCPTITGNLINGNLGGGMTGGGGMHCQGVGTSPRIEGNTITGNTAYYGGGIDCGFGATALVLNNVISGNASNHTGGGVHTGSPGTVTTLVGNTIVGNDAATSGGNVWCCDSSGLSATNCIVSGAVRNGGIAGEGGCAVTVTYCDVYGNAGGDYLGTAAAGAGCFSADPLFADAAGGDLHLKSSAGRWNGTIWVFDTVNSPCLDAADPAAAYANEPAPNGIHANLGAYGNTAQASKSPQLARIVETGQYWGRIQSAIGGAANGQTVEVSVGTHHERIDFLGKAITVRSTDPDDDATVAATVIDGDAGGSVVSFTHGETGSSVLDGLAITNGSGTDLYSQGYTFGGGVLCVGSSPRIQNCCLKANTVTGSGAGMYADDGSPTISGNTIEGNVAHSEYGGAGGGLYCESGSPTVSDNRIAGNTGANCAGGLYLNSCSSPQVLRNTIVENTVGGLLLLHCTDALIQGNTITGNVNGQGAGIWMQANTATLIESNNIRDNHTESSGGGLYFYSDRDPTVRRNVVEGNRAGLVVSNGGGLALYLVRGTATIVGNVIARNAANCGGGIALSGSTTDPGTALLAGNSVVGNSGTNAAGIYLRRQNAALSNSLVVGNTGYGIRLDDGCVLTVTYCNVWNNSYGNYRYMADPTGTNGNISVDPVFASAAAGDYHLCSQGGRWDPVTERWVRDLVSSPCIDAGDPASDWAQEPAPNGGRVNMGFEGNTAYASKTPDRPPSAPTSLAVTPASPLTGDDLLAVADGSVDLDGDPFLYQYQWRMKPPGGEWGTWSSEGPLVSHDATTLGQQWMTRARAIEAPAAAVGGRTIAGVVSRKPGRPSRAAASSPWRESAAVTIGNTLPTAPTVVTVTPADPLTGDDLVAAAEGSSDADGATLTYDYQWAKFAPGDTAWGPWGNPGETLPASLTAKGERWKARGRAHDGTAHGPWKQSAQLVIGNTAPGAPTAVAITPSAPRTDDTLTASASGSVDADGTTVSYSYQWAKMAAGSSTWGAWGNARATVNKSLTTLGDRWKTRSRAFDGARYSGWFEGAPVTIADTPPTAPTLVEIEAGPAAGQLTARVEGSTDADGEAPMYMWQWRRWVTTPTAGWGAWGSTNVRTLSGVTARQKYQVRGQAVCGAPVLSSAWVCSAAYTVPVAAAGELAAAATALTLSASAAAAPNGSVQVTVHPSAAATVEVVICNLAGRPVAALAPCQVSAGTTALCWSGRGSAGTRAPAGVYLVRVTACSGGGLQARAVSTVTIGR